MVTYLGSLVPSCCGEGGTLQTNVTGVCGECSQCMDQAGFAPARGVCLLAPGCSAGAPSKVGSVFRALPRSKPLRFSSCVLCLSQVQAAQLTRCLASALSQLGGASYHLPGPRPLVSCVCLKSAISGVPCVSSGAVISGCDPPCRCQPSRIPGRLG